MPEPPRLTPEERAQFDEGVRLFNAGHYFECHDVLEDLWSGVRGESRDFFQGLIQVAVAFYHLERENPEGARSMFERATRRFSAYPGRYFGFDLDAERARIETRLARLASAEPAPAAPLDSPPQWSFDPQ